MQRAATCKPPVRVCDATRTRRALLLLQRPPAAFGVAVTRGSRHSVAHDAHPCICGHGCAFALRRTAWARRRAAVLRAGETQSAASWGARCQVALRCWQGEFALACASCRHEQECRVPAGGPPLLQRALLGKAAAYARRFRAAQHVPDAGLCSTAPAAQALARGCAQLSNAATDVPQRPG